jgi:tyrosine-protein kinase Etk/Wzc
MKIDTLESAHLGPQSPSLPSDYDHDDGDPGVTLVELLTWLGERKGFVATSTAFAAAAGLAIALLLPPVYTARATLMTPGTQQQSGSAAALAALGSLGGLTGGLGSKTPDELYVALLKSDSVQRPLADRFDLKKRYKVESYEALRKTLPGYVRVAADKKSGLISVEVDDEEPKFAADLANAHAGEVARVLGRLAVSEAQLRRVFFENQLKETKERLIKAEVDLQRVQEKSGVIVLDKQAEALISGAAQVRASIAEREVQLKVLRGSATEQNPQVVRLATELRALRAELSRMESNRGGAPGSAADMPVGKLPEAAIDYVRARRELKLQETLLETMVRQYEIAKLDEAKEGPQLQTVDIALPPDHKAKPSRSVIVIGAVLLGLVSSAMWVVTRRYGAWSRARYPETAPLRDALARAWRFGGGKRA